MGHFPIFFLQISNPPCFPGVGVVGVSDDKCITYRSIYSQSGCSVALTIASSGCNLSEQSANEHCKIDCNVVIFRRAEQPV